MGGNQGEPSSSRQEPVGPPEREGAPPGAGERIGPVAIVRHVKGDGRALILYTVDRQSRS